MNNNTSDIFEMFPSPDIIKYNLAYFSYKYTHYITVNKYVNVVSLLKYSDEGNVRMMKLILPFFIPSQLCLSECLARAVKNNHVGSVSVLLDDHRLSIREICISVNVCVDYYNHDILMLLLDYVSLNKDEKGWMDLMSLILTSIMQDITHRNKNDMIPVLLEFIIKHNIYISYYSLNYNEHNFDILVKLLLDGQKFPRNNIVDVCSRVASSLDKLDVLTNLLMNDNAKSFVDISACLSNATYFNSHSCITYLLPFANRRNINKSIINSGNAMINNNNLEEQKRYSRTIDIYMENNRVDEETLQNLASRACFNQGYSYKLEYLMKYYIFDDDNFSIIEKCLTKINSSSDYVKKSNALYSNLIFNKTININKLRDHFKFLGYIQQLEDFNIEYNNRRNTL